MSTAVLSSVPRDTHHGDSMLNRYTLVRIIHTLIQRRVQQRCVYAGQSVSVSVCHCLQAGSHGMDEALQGCDVSLGQRHRLETRVQRVATSLLALARTGT